MNYLPLDHASSAFIALSETALCDLCFRTTHAAASPVKPFLYASINLHDRLINFWMTSLGHASKTLSARVLASAKLFFRCSRYRYLHHPQYLEQFVR